MCPFTLEEEENEKKENARFCMYGESCKIGETKEICVRGTLAEFGLIASG